jgi:choline kinase
MRIIILAAGQGTRLRPLTDDRPKCLVELAGRPLLQWQLECAAEVGINDIIVVGGYLIDQLRSFGVPMIENSAYATTNMVYTLFCAKDLFGEEFIVSYGDIVYGPEVLRTLVASTAPVSIIVDRLWRNYWAQRFADPLANAESLRTDGSGRILSIGQMETDINRIESQFIGLLAFRQSGVTAVRATFAAAQREAQAGRPPFGGPRPLEKLFTTDLLQGMINLGFTLIAVPVNGGWVEIDSIQDITLAERLIAAGRLKVA